MSTITISSRQTSPGPMLAVAVGVAAIGLVVAVLLVLLFVPTTSGSTTGVATVNGSGTSGTLSLTVGRDDRATLRLDVQGLTPGHEYPVHLHSGTPSQAGASLGVLGMLRADANGRAQLVASSVRGGAVGVAFDLTGTLLADGPRFVDIHAEGAPDAIAVALVQ